MLGFLFGILCLIIGIYVVYLVIGMLKLPAEILTIVYLIVGLIFLYIIFQMVSGVNWGGLMRMNN